MEKLESELNRYGEFSPQFSKQKPIIANENEGEPQITDFHKWFCRFIAITRV